MYIYAYINSCAKSSETQDIVDLISYLTPLTPLFTHSHYCLYVYIYVYIYAESSETQGIADLISYPIPPTHVSRTPLPHLSHTHTHTHTHTCAACRPRFFGANSSACSSALLSASSKAMGSSTYSPPRVRESSLLQPVMAHVRMSNVMQSQV